MLPAPPGVPAPDSGFAPWPAPGPCAAARLMLSAKHAAAVEINNWLLIGKLSLDLVGGPSRNHFPSHVMSTSFAMVSSNASRSMREVPVFLNWRSPRGCCCATTDGGASVMFPLVTVSRVRSDVEPASVRNAADLAADSATTLVFADGFHRPDYCRPCATPV